MKILVDERTKVRISRSGPVRTFGDFDSRESLGEVELANLFDERWEHGLGKAVENSLPCEFEVARSRLQGRQTGFIDANQEQRQFRYQSMDFIVQFNKSSDGTIELTQLWKVQSGDDHPKTLFVTFDTVAERKRFKRIADHLSCHDEALGLRILEDFMEKFDLLIPLAEEE